MQWYNSKEIVNILFLFQCIIGGKFVEPCFGWTQWSVSLQFWGCLCPGYIPVSLPVSDNTIYGAVGDDVHQTEYLS